MRLCWCVCVQAHVLLCVYELYVIKHTESIRSTHHFGGSGGIHMNKCACTFKHVYVCVSIGVHISMHTLSNTLKAYVRALVLVCVDELYLIKHTESIRSTHHFGGSGGIHMNKCACTFKHVYVCKYRCAYIYAHLVKHTEGICACACVGVCVCVCL